MIDMTDTLNRLFSLEEQAVLKAGPAMDRASQLVEGRRRVAVGAAWLALARNGSDFMTRKTLNSVVHHLRQAQQILEREMAR